MHSTKERIPDVALTLFAERGYAGTSMRDIAGALGITKGALYRHYTGKEAVLAAIVARMEALDTAEAEAHEMPLGAPGGDAEEYRRTPLDRIRDYSMAQFRHWTEDSFSARFRRLLTLEQYRDPTMARLYRDYLAAGPTEYMAAIFRSVTASDRDAMQLALDFYGPMFLLYSIYDGAVDKAAVLPLLEAHIDGFMRKHALCDPRT